MVGIRGTGAPLCKATGLLQPPYFLRFLSKEQGNGIEYVANKHNPPALTV